MARDCIQDARITASPSADALSRGGLDEDETGRGSSPPPTEVAIT
jgi:hypothetical protein